MGAEWCCGVVGGVCDGGLGVSVMIYPVLWASVRLHVDLRLL